jgi:sugar phosphate isomerase/epimerase
MLLGFKVDGIIRNYGWGTGADSDWDIAKTEKELRFQREQGFQVVEITADMSSQTGAFFKVSKDEWRKTKAVIEEAGLRLHSVLAWRRMICRPPWAEEKWQDLLCIASVAESLSIPIIDIMVAPPLPQGDRPLLRSIDATQSDYEISAAKLKEYAQRLANFGVAISLEIHEDTIHDCAPAALRLLQMIDEPNVGVNPDTLDNGWIFPEESLPDAIEQAQMVAPYVNHWHVKQYIRTLGPDGQWQREAAHADEGTQPIGEMARIFFAAGFKGAIIQECGRGGGNEAMRRFIDYMRSLTENSSLSCHQ